jgi:hypothetical protein
MSTDEFEIINPVNPPRTKQIRNAITRRSSLERVFALYRDEIQVKIFNAVGIAMIIVAELKYKRDSSTIPAIYI